MFSKKGRKRDEYAINFDLLYVINFIFPYHLPMSCEQNYSRAAKRMFYAPLSIQKQSFIECVHFLHFLIIRNNYCMYIFFSSLIVFHEKCILMKSKVQTNVP